MVKPCERLALKSSYCVLHVRFHSNKPNIADPPRDFRQQVVEEPKPANLDQYFMNS